MENNQIEFQVTQNWGDGCKAWEYFTINSSASDEEIKEKAIECIRNDWEKQKRGPRFSVPEKCKKTIKIAEYANGKKVNNGIRLTTKWR